MGIGVGVGVGEGVGAMLGLGLISTAPGGESAAQAQRKSVNIIIAGSRNFFILIKIPPPFLSLYRMGIYSIIIKS